MNKILFILLLILTLAACMPVTPLTPKPTHSWTPTAPAPPTNTPLPVSTNPIDPAGRSAVLAARVALANTLGIRYDEVDIASVESVEWPDGCLGAGRPDEMCTQAIVPGYRVLLNIGPIQYELRTNIDGTVTRWVGHAKAISESSTPVLIWQSTHCDIFSVTNTRASYGKCGDSTLTTPKFIVPENITIVSAWEIKFKSFEAETPAGKVTFNGRGNLVATPSEQRMMAEWASLTNDIAVSERAGAAWGLAFSWSREGGIAGFCDNVGVYRNGLVISFSCGSNDVNYRLTASQLDRLYYLLDTFSTIDYEYKDPAVADAMTIRLTFSGNGAQTARESDITAINEFAAELAALGNFNRILDPNIEDAKAALVDFLASMNNSDFIRAAKLYGGDTALLATWNPDIKHDLSKWLERGCQQNGLQCLLPRTVIYRGPDARGGYQFYIEFNNPDGTLFRQGGDAPGSISNFIFAVVKQNDLWLVMDLPPYTP